MQSEQKRLDFNEGSKIRRLESSHIAGRGPLKEILLAVATQQASHDDGFPSIPEIAKAIGASDSTVRRGIREMEDLGLVKVRENFDHRGRQIPSTIEFNWSKIFSLPAQPGMTGGDSTVTGGAVTKAVTPLSCNPSMTPLPSGGGGAHSFSKKAKSKSHECHDMGDENEIQKFERREEEPLDPVEAVGGRWMARKLKIHELRHAPTVLLLFEYCVRRGWVGPGEFSQVHFFALARYCAHKGRTPALFTDMLKRQDFSYRIEDENAAREVLKKLRGDLQQRVSRDDDLSESEDLERYRREQIEALRKRP